MEPDAVRQLIRQGIPRRMPRFQYTLNASEMDDLIAYLKIRYPLPSARLSHGTDVDTKGNVWESTGAGAVRMNIQTGELTEFRTPAEFSRPYDLGVDS